MTGEHEQLLRQATARNLAAVLSLPSAGMLRHCKSRLLVEADSTLVIEAPDHDRILIEELIRTGENCGVSFKTGNYKAVFAATILRQIPQYQVKPGLFVDALALKWPDQLKCAQRRSNYRVSVPKESGITIRLWRLMERAQLRDLPSATQLIQADLIDLSVGGAGVRLVGADGKAPKVTVDDRLRLELKAAGDTFVLEGKMRTPSSIPQPDIYLTGVAFKKLQNDLEGRQIVAKLSRILGELQREELRRYRLGLMRPPTAA